MAAMQNLSRSQCCAVHASRFSSMLHTTIISTNQCSKTKMALNTKHHIPVH